MSRRQSPTLSTMLDLLDELASSRHFVSVEQMLETTGQTSFGPMLLIPGLVVISPVGGMPGVPTLVALLVAISAVQLVVGRSYIWLPRWLLKRKAPQKHLKRAIAFMRPIARFSEKIVRERMRWMTGTVGTRIVAGCCLFICLLMPPLEVVPFANSMCGVALSLFGMGLIARDGILTSLAFFSSIAAFAALAIKLF